MNKNIQKSTWDILNMTQTDDKGKRVLTEIYNVILVLGISILTGMGTLFITSFYGLGDGSLKLFIYPLGATAISATIMILWASAYLDDILDYPDQVDATEQLERIADRLEEVE